MSSGEIREKHEEKNHCPYALRHALCALRFCLRAAGRESSPHRYPRFKHGFWYRGPPGRVSARAGKLGWVEGKNIAVEYRFAEQKRERLPELAADLVRLKVDLIVITGETQALAAKGATTTIPIVMANPADPVSAGLVASLARPGGNVTGLSGLAPS